MDDQLIPQFRDKMHKALEITRNDLASIRTGRAAPSLIENIVINVYGGAQKMKMMELATISTPDHSTLLLTPYDPSIIGEIAKGLLETNVGLNPIIDGKIIRISIPPLSEERRKEYIKFAYTKLEAGKIIIRQIRHDGMVHIKRAAENKEINEDDRTVLQKQMQDATDEMIGQLDQMGEAKERELLQI